MSPPTEERTTSPTEQEMVPKSRYDSLYKNMNRAALNLQERLDDQARLRRAAEARAEVAETKLEAVREWAASFREPYPIPGETPTDYEEAFADGVEHAKKWVAALLDDPGSQGGRE